MSNDLKNQVNAIISTLENPPEYCPCCECEADTDEATVCPECGEESRPMSAYEYLSDVLDIEYVVSSSREYLGARVLVCFGGPNVWVNTRTNTVEGHWWADSFAASYTDNIGLDDACNELYDCQ